MVNPEAPPARPLRVGLVCPYDLDVPGGVREQVMGLADVLVAGGDEVSVLAPRRRGAPQLERARGVLVRSAGPAVGLPTNGSTARLAIGPLARARAAAWADSGFDVVHVHEPIPPGVGHTVLRQLARRRGTRVPGPAVVATVHVAMSPRPAGRSRSLRTASRHVGSTLRAVDVLTAVSEHARRTLVDHLGRVPLVLPNGVDVAGWAAAPPVREGDGPVVLVLGRADEPRKGVDVLLRAWPQVLTAVPDARLVVVGPSRGVTAAPGVSLVGTVGEARKRSLVAGADVLVAPHRGGESFGIVLVEAMAAGTPVVASDLPAFRDVLAGAGVLVPPGDAAALATAVLAVLDGARGPSGADRVAAGSARAQGYAWPVVGAAWRRVYAMAMEVSPGVDAAMSLLRHDLRARAAAALELAADPTGEPAGSPRWRAELAAAARSAAAADDLPAQSRLTALVRGATLPPHVGQELTRWTGRVQAVRTVANELARRDGAETVELDDDAGAGGTSRASWPWCPSLD